MTYCVTGMFARPDVGFKAERRMTARGAKALADAFRAEGRVYVEIRNDRGEIIDRERIDRDIAANGASEDDVTRRIEPAEGAVTYRSRSTENSASPLGPAETGSFDSRLSAG